MYNISSRSQQREGLKARAASTPGRSHSLPTQTAWRFAGAGGVTRVWSWRDGSIREFTGHPIPVQTGGFSADGRKLITISGGYHTQNPRPGDSAATLLVFDLAGGTTDLREDLHYVIHSVLSRDGSTLAAHTSDANNAGEAGTSSARIIVRETRTGGVIGTLPAEGFLLVLSPDGRLCHNRHTVWDVRTRRAVRTGVERLRVFVGNDAAISVRTGSGLPNEWFYAQTRLDGVCEDRLRQRPPARAWTLLRNSRR